MLCAQFRNRTLTAETERHPLKHPLYLLSYNEKLFNGFLSFNKSGEIIASILLANSIKASKNAKTSKNDKCLGILR